MTDAHEWERPFGCVVHACRTRRSRPRLRRETWLRSWRPERGKRDPSAVLGSSGEESRHIMYIRPAAIITLLILLWSFVAPAQTWGAPAAPGLQAPASATADAPERAIYRVRIDAAEPLR